MKEKTKSFLKDLGAGVAMGASSTIPGGSGGTIASMLGVYDRHLEHMNNLKKDFWHNFKSLLPIGIGIIFGFLPASILFQIAFEGFIFGIVCFSGGIVIGGMPLITDNIKKDPITKKNIIILIICAIFTAGLGILATVLDQFHVLPLGDIVYKAINISPVTHQWIEGGSINPWIYVSLLPIGVISAMALILPGVSGAMLLLIFGYYNSVLDTLNVWKAILQGRGTWEMALSTSVIYVSLFVGMVIGFFTIVKVLKNLLDNKRVPTYYGIIGFILGSIVSLFCNPIIVNYYKNWESIGWLPMAAELPIGIVLLAISTGLTYWMVVLNRKKAAANINSK